MRIRTAFWISVVCLLPRILIAQAPGTIVTKVASNHPMIYLISLPKNWSPGKTWPVVVAIEDADRDFARNMKSFVDARGTMPFILVVPEVVTNGGSRYREAPGYGYKQADWDRIVGNEWRFDDEGLAAVIADVHKLYGGEERYYLTGWEAGAHTVFAETFNHPDRILAAAAVCPNYQGRYVSFSDYKKTPVVYVLGGSEDPAWVRGQPLFDQAKRAEAEGRAHGFLFAWYTARRKGHEPLAPDVLQWFRIQDKGAHKDRWPSSKSG